MCPTPTSAMRKRVLNRTHAADLRQHMEKCSAGMQAAHDIVELLDKDNAIFGLYLKHEAARHLDHLVGIDKSTQHRSVDTAAARRACRSRSTSDESGARLPLVDVKDQDSVGIGGGHNTIPTNEQLPSAVDACRQLKLEARARALHGDVVLSQSAVGELDAICSSLQQTPNRNNMKRASKHFQAMEVPFARSALRAVHRRETKWRRVPASPKFKARPLPQMYRVVNSPKFLGEADVATRTVSWYLQKQTQRAQAREARHRAALAEMQPAPDIDISARSWATAKIEAARAADAHAAEESLRRQAAAKHEAWKQARTEAVCRQLERERKELEGQKKTYKREAVQPRPDAPITRPTKAYQAAIAARSNMGVHAQLAARQIIERSEPIFDAEFEDPYSGIEPLRLDPKVLALIGEDVNDDANVLPLVNSARIRPAPCDGKLKKPSRKALDTEPAVMDAQIESSIGFFDALSSSERGRKQCRDARLFHPASMQRVNVEPGIVMLTGKLADPPHSELCICVLFDRHRFSEVEAEAWWAKKGKLLCGCE